MFSFFLGEMFIATTDISYSTHSSETAAQSAKKIKKLEHQLRDNFNEIGSSGWRYIFAEFSYESNKWRQYVQ